MKTYIQGLITGFLLCSTAILLMGAGDDKIEAGRYEYYISTDDITKKHYSRIFDTTTGVVYHKQFTPGGEQTDIQWVNGERIERKHFRPDLSIWKSDNWDEYEKAYRGNRNLNF